MASDAEAASRTVLELIATVMDASFEVLGEGIVLGTMPAYLERFGAKNARYLARSYVECDANQGAVSALTPLNFLSRQTATPFQMPMAQKDHAVKRLQSCEFLGAFENKAPFAKTMICSLHRAVYQGSVNGLLEDPSKSYDVTLRSRILFGDPHCDFEVTSRAPRPAEPDREGKVRRVPDAAEREQQALHFYTSILVAFVDYLSSVLPPDQVALLLEDCSARVGTKVHDLLAVRPGGAKATPTELAASILTLGGRTVETAPGGVLRVTACPFADPIQSATKRHDGEAGRRVREGSCRMCVGVLSSAAAAQRTGADVARETCLTLGDADCRFRVADGQGGKAR